MPLTSLIVYFRECCVTQQGPLSHFQEMLPFADKSHARVGRINRFNCGFLVTKILLSVHMFQITGGTSSSPGQMAGGLLFSFLKNKNNKTNEQMKMRHQEKTKPKKTPLGTHNFWINQLWLYHKNAQFSALSLTSGAQICATFRVAYNCIQCVQVYNVLMRLICVQLL